MVWDSLHWVTATLAERAASLLHEVTLTTQAAWNGTQPLLQGALHVLHQSLERVQQCQLPHTLHLQLDTFQAHLLLLILAILAANVVLVYLAWSMYGERIVQHFTTKESTEKIRDLGIRQNLPKEYTPKY